MADRPRLLDLFSGAGGCARGYTLAGFEVHGVDHKPQPRYLLSGAASFTQADALEFLAAHGHEFDAVHASPPCQAYSRTRSIHGREHPDLLPATRAALSGLPLWVIENVADAPMYHAFTLCGGMFGLGVWRHRKFECSHLIAPPPHRRHLGATTAPRGTYDRGFGGMVTVAGNNFCPAVAREAMGIPWMTGKELAQAIPPAYTLFIGERLMALQETPSRTRQEHVEWCKRRAREYLARGETQEAVTSMMSDLTKHPDTAGLINGAGPLAMIGMMAAAGSQEEARYYIEGFN
jgi:DNA (cytosine-5)-methyltransferase 1